MNTKLIATIIVTSVASYLLLTEYRGNLLIQKRIDFNEDGLTVEEKAGYYTVNRATEIFPSKMGSEMRFQIGQTSNGSVFMQFASPIVWNEQYSNDTLVAVKNFRDAIFRYFEDITEKLVIRGVIGLTSVNLSPTTNGDSTFVQIRLGIQCKIDPKLRMTRILQCQVAAAKLAKQISVNELTFYLNAYAAFEEVVGVGDYEEYEDFDSDVLVTHVDPLGSNFYKIKAEIYAKFVVDELFKCVFKNYTSENLEFNSFFSDESKIAVDNIHEEQPIETSETHVSFDLYVFNIEILQKDIQLVNRTMFDEIFMLFDANEFRHKLYSIDECRSLITRSMTNDREESATAVSNADNNGTTTVESVSNATHFDGINDDSATHTIESDSDDVNRAELTEDEGSGDGDEEELDAEVSERSVMYGSSERRKINAQWLCIIQFILILNKFL